MPLRDWLSPRDREAIRAMAVRQWQDTVRLELADPDLERAARWPFTLTQQDLRFLKINRISADR